MRAQLFSLLLGLGACATDPSPATDSSFLAFGSSASTVTLAWVAAPGATAYTIERKSSGGDYTQVATVTDTDFMDGHLDAQTTYTYRVSAVGANAVHEQDATTTNVKPLITDVPAITGAPTTATIDATGGTITIANPRAQVTIPPGAVSDGTSITVQPIVGPVVEDDSLGLEIASPAGFAQPIDVAFALDDGDKLAPDQMVMVVQQDDGMWVAQHRTLDMAAGKVSSSIAWTGSSARIAPGAPLKLRVTRLRATWIEPKQAEVKVTDTIKLTAFGVFSDLPCQVAPGASADWECIGVVGLSGMAGLWDVNELKRPPNQETLQLHNTWPNYTRTWTVENQPLGSSTLGFITIPTNMGANYMAPSLKPSKNPVAVRFTSTEDPSTSVDHTAFKANARPSLLTIVGGMGYHVKAVFNADHNLNACPVAESTMDDGFEFDLAQDMSGELHVVGITNQTTAVSNVVWGDIWTNVVISDAPEVITVVDGSVTSLPNTPIAEVMLMGTTKAGACTGTALDGSVMTYPGTPIPPMLTLAFDTSSMMPTATLGSYWTVTITPK